MGISVPQADANWSATRDTCDASDGCMRGREASGLRRGKLELRAARLAVKRREELEALRHRQRGSPDRWDDQQGS